MKFELGFGTGTQKVEIPEKNLLAVLEPNKVETGLTGEDAVKEALEESDRLKTRLRKS
jgi:hypothetical protein